VFGDQVCRGCRRFSYEVIEWNRYTPEQKLMVWQRLDEQLDRVVVPLVPYANPHQIKDFLAQRQVRLMPSNSEGRRIFEAMRVCQRTPELLPQSGLNLSASDFETVWPEIEKRLYTLAMANFEFTWLRAEHFGH